MGFTRNCRDRIVAIENTIIINSTSVKGAAYIPVEIHDDDLPLMVNIPRTRQRINFYDRLATYTRRWDLTLYWRPIHEEFDDTNEDDVLDIMDAVPRIFNMRPRLEDDNGNGLAQVQEALLADDTDTGLFVYAYPENSLTYFYAVRFNLLIRYEEIC